MRDEDYERKNKEYDNSQMAGIITKRAGRIRRQNTVA
jgi:hypothetical protein